MDGIQIKRVTCKKEGCKRILEEESDLKRTLKENFERKMHLGRYIRNMINYSFRVFNKLFQMLMEFSTNSQHVKH